MQAGFQCAYCGEWNDTDVDASGGGSQQYTEDCQVCCQPNLLSVRFDRAQGEPVVHARREN